MKDNSICNKFFFLHIPNLYINVLTVCKRYIHMYYVIFILLLYNEL